MSKLIAYTIELYKKDNRIKKDERYGNNKVGKRFVEKIDISPVTKDYIGTVVAQYLQQGFIVDLFETYRTKINMMNGQEYQERYDTPYYCSPSSETYWSM